MNPTPRNPWRDDLSSRTRLTVSVIAQALAMADPAERSGSTMLRIPFDVSWILADHGIGESIRAYFPDHAILFLPETNGPHPPSIVVSPR